jgi:hypothetical protein
VWSCAVPRRFECAQVAHVAPSLTVSPLYVASGAASPSARRVLQHADRPLEFAAASSSRHLPDWRTGSNSLKPCLSIGESASLSMPCSADRSLLPFVARCFPQLSALRPLAMSHSSDHTLEAILTLAHADEDAKKYTAAGRPAAACPLTLVEETLTCAADFLLLQAISTFLERNKSAAPSHPQPAVVLCTFKQSGLHYSHIARKWVSLSSSCRDARQTNF